MDLGEYFTGDVSVDKEDTLNRLNYDSRPHLDPDAKIFKGISNIVRWGIFHKLAHISDKTYKFLENFIIDVSSDKQQGSPH